MGKLIKFSHVNEHGDFPALLAHFGLEYTRKGDQLRLRCPLPDHEDQKPSMSVTLVKTDKASANTFHCFGCGNSGSIIDFAAHVASCDLRTAAETVADVSGCGLAPPRANGARRRGGNGQKSAKPAESAGERHTAASGSSDGTGGGKAKSAAPVPSGEADGVNPPLRFSLKLDPAHEYLQSRVSRAAIKDFGLGYLPKTSKSMMAGRICIPILDVNEDLIGYAGRFPSNEVPKDEEKFLMPPRFNKLATLFNIDRVFNRGHVVVVEGFFDAIRLHELGIPAVALMGTTASWEQAKLLSDAGIEQAVLLLDGDDAGRAAVAPALAELSRELYVRVAELPDGSDPETVDETTLVSLTRR